MVNYLEFFPKPLLVDLCENQVLPFVGSGFSLNAMVPPGRRMPLISQIANCLNELMPDFVGMGPMDIISEFDIRFGRAQWAEELYKMLLVGVAKPGTAHLAFARLPFDIVATTNVDQLLEEAYFQVDRFPQVIMFDEQLPVKDTADNPVSFFKIHGDVNFPDRLIWTEQDYDTFVARFPLQATYLACLLITHTPLFIGYSVDDYDFRQIWNIIGERLGHLRRRAYAIEVAATPSMIARYQRRGVEVINLPGDRANFGPILTTAFRQLRQFLATGCPPEGIPPCATLGVPIDISGTDGSDDDDDRDARHRRSGRRDSNRGDSDHGRSRGRNSNHRGTNRWGADCTGTDFSDSDVTDTNFDADSDIDTDNTGTGWMDSHAESSHPRDRSRRRRSKMPRQRDH